MSFTKNHKSIGNAIIDQIRKLQSHILQSSQKHVPQACIYISFLLICININYNMLTKSALTSVHPSQLLFITHVSFHIY